MNLKLIILIAVMLIVQAIFITSVFRISLAAEKQKFFLAPIQESTNLGLFTLEKNQMKFLQSMKYDFKKQEAKTMTK